METRDGFADNGGDGSTEIRGVPIGVVDEGTVDTAAIAGDCRGDLIRLSLKGNCENIGGRSGVVA
jgi:hypothetical protein